MGEDAKNVGEASGERDTTSSSVEENTRSVFTASVKEIKLFGKFFEIYPRKKARVLAEQYYIDVILHTAGASEENILAAAENYAKECKKNKTKEMFIKMAHNWLKDFTWIDYLPENYKEQESESEQEQKRERMTNNRFNNIQQRTYDFNELEKVLLGG